MNPRIIVYVFCALALTAHRNASSVETGQAAPNCSLTGSEQPLDVQRFRGKIVYIDFWASWCAPCAQSFPFMNELDRDYRDKGLQVVGVNVDKKTEDAKKFLGKHPASFAVAYDAAGQCPRDFGVPGMPTSYLIDRKGAVRYVHLGFRRDDAGTIRGKVEELLAEAPTGP